MKQKAFNDLEGICCVLSEKFVLMCRVTKRYSVRHLFFKVDNTSIEHKRVLRQLWDGKMFFFSLKISLQTACSIDTDALTSWFSRHDSYLPSYVAQYEPVSCIPALWSIKSIAQLESGQMIKWLVHFSVTCRWHRVYTMEPILGLRYLGRLP